MMLYEKHTEHTEHTDVGRVFSAYVVFLFFSLNIGDTWCHSPGYPFPFIDIGSGLAAYVAVPLCMYESLRKHIIINTVQSDVVQERLGAHKNNAFIKIATSEVVHFNLLTQSA
eukprot:1134527-Pelagomonas_calceolata.AAC.1